MPLVKIYMAQRSGTDRAGLATALRQVFQEILGAPAEDGPVMFFELDPSNWHMPAGWPEGKIFVEITLYPGRTRETKERLLAAVAQAVAAALDVPVTYPLITLHEPPLDNWGIRGGKQASQIGVGFKLDV